MKTLIPANLTPDSAMIKLVDSVETALNNMHEKRRAVCPVIVQIRESSLDTFTKCLSVAVRSRYKVTSDSISNLTRFFDILIEKGILTILPSKDANYHSVLDVAKPTLVFTENTKLIHQTTSSRMPCSSPNVSNIPKGVGIEHVEPISDAHRTALFNAISEIEAKFRADSKEDVWGQD